MSENGLEGLLDKAKTSGQIAGEMGRRFCSFDSMTAREFQTMKWISEKDVVEFFKTKVVVDRKQLSDIEENLLQKLHAYGLRDSDEKMLVNSIELDIKHVFGEAFSVKGFKGSVEAQK